jgi:hypothetical protein
MSQRASQQVLTSWLLLCPAAIPAAGVTKDAAWITDLHAALIRILSGGNDKLCRGVHKDNTKATTQLEELFPHMVCLGCAGHNLNLGCMGAAECRAARDCLWAYGSVLWCHYVSGAFRGAHSVLWLSLSMHAAQEKGYVPLAQGCDCTV